MSTQSESAMTHTPVSPGEAPVRAAGAFSPSPQQVNFFETFGFVKFPGLFAEDIDEIVGGFERVFATQPTWETNADLHLNQRRVIIPGFVDKDARLSALLDDHRVLGVLDGLIGPGRWEYAESDGNLFYCDSSWHPDTYSAPLTRLHVKLSFYLDPLHGRSGAIRMIPGTNYHKTPYAKQLRRTLEPPERIPEVYGVRHDEIPSWTIESDPGDLIVWNFRTIHGSFGGGERRRLFSINFRALEDDATS